MINEIPDINDMAYMIIWSVGLDANHVVTEITLYAAIEMARLSNGKRPFTVDFNPSEKFIKRAKTQIKALDWSEFKANSTDASAISYLYHADPDTPESTNEQRR